VTITIEQITDVLWEVPTNVEGARRYLHLVREWPEGGLVPVTTAVVAAFNTFERDGEVHGDFACYIGAVTNLTRRLDVAQWVARHGTKLSVREAYGFGFSERDTAPNGLEVVYRP
jgi:hypothetical protein